MATVVWATWCEQCDREVQVDPISHIVQSHPDGRFDLSMDPRLHTGYLVPHNQQEEA